MHTAKRKVPWTAKRATSLWRGLSQGGGCDSAQEGFSFGEEASLMGHGRADGAAWTHGGRGSWTLPAGSGMEGSSPGFDLMTSTPTIFCSRC